MEFLYEEIDTLRKAGMNKEMPKYISDNINQNFELRPYQIKAFENFITYFENDNLCQKPTQTLFHMATGSGKTLIMAGLILYFYKQGYRNFIFFVNLSNILKKTKDNFLNKASSKYLFADEIIIDGEYIRVNEVDNFQNIDMDAINIHFTSIQKLHDMRMSVKENDLCMNDFENCKIVLISDEAHHLNVSTKKSKKIQDLENESSWEYTVMNILNKNIHNVLLEFTATCDLGNIKIKNRYQNKIIFDYPLKKFRQDLYSKEIVTLRSDLNRMERALQALMLSQYRLKLFQDNRLSIKPIILFKSAKIVDSKIFMKDFLETLKNLTGSTLEKIANSTNIDIMKKAYSYFKQKGITFENLAMELKEDFSEIHCISVNDDKETEKNQILLNSLEDINNPYRAIFEVKKLDEGWDVLNLFDIVRLYETRDSKNGKPGATTVAEAQLIGRGARYCPFKLDDEQEKYKRKYDNDLENPLRVCEELYYHCQNSSRYISELKTALSEIGIDSENTVTKHYILKEDFKKDKVYTEGFVFMNKRETKSRNNINNLSPKIKDNIYTVNFNTGDAGKDILLSDEVEEKNNTKNYLFKTTFKKISEINYAIVNKALMKHKILKFNILKSYFPNLKSIREFVTSSDYLGDIEIYIKSTYEFPTNIILYKSCLYVLGKIANSISEIKEEYYGTKEFQNYYIHDIFKDKTVHYTNPHNGGIGISQNDNSVPNEYKLDLSKEDWFVFYDNFGTSEEKSFVSYFKNIVEDLKQEYKKVYLIRNERQLHIYSFDDGLRFEPDYLILLQKSDIMGIEQLQIFVEPKGSHLLEKDKWKEKFLLQLEEKAIPITKFVDDNEYRIWGFHFFNKENRNKEFNDDIKKLCFAKNE